MPALLRLPFSRPDLSPKHGEEHRGEHEFKKISRQEGIDSEFQHRLVPTNENSQPNESGNIDEGIADEQGCSGGKNIAVPPFFRKPADHAGGEHKAYEITAGRPRYVSKPDAFFRRSGENGQAEGALHEISQNGYGAEPPAERHADTKDDEGLHGDRHGPERNLDLCGNPERGACKNYQAQVTEQGVVPVPESLRKSVLRECKREHGSSFCLIRLERGEYLRESLHVRNAYRDISHVDFDKLALCARVCSNPIGLLINVKKNIVAVKF